MEKLRLGRLFVGTFGLVNRSPHNKRNHSPTAPHSLARSTRNRRPPSQMGSMMQEMTRSVPLFKTRRALNGSTYRIDESQDLAVRALSPRPKRSPGGLSLTGVEPRVWQMRCTEDHVWLQSALAQRGVKAYLPTISVNDPKQRRPANELTDWCSGDGFKLWSTTEHRYVPSLVVAGNRLNSMPTGQAPASA